MLIVPHSEMAAVALLIVSCCLLMLSGCSEGRDLSQAVYKAPSSSQCGHYEDDEQLMETLKIVQQQLCNPPHACIYRHSALQLICLLRLLPDPGCQWLCCAGLLRHGGDPLWRRGRLDEGGPPQHD